MSRSQHVMNLYAELDGELYYRATNPTQPLSMEMSMMLYEILGRPKQLTVSVEEGNTLGEGQTDRLELEEGSAPARTRESTQGEACH